MKACLLAFAALAIYSSDANEELEKRFHSFTTLYNKEYKPAEVQYRLGIYSKNDEFVAQKNAQKLGFTLELNEFADLTDEEFEKRRLSNPEAKTELNYEQFDAKQFKYLNPVKAVDWHAKGCVTPVRDQGFCGSCWAFAAISSLEGAICAKTGVIPSLSEQELVDCSHQNNGCNGGLMGPAFDYIKKYGICNAEDYSYTATQGECRADKCINKNHMVNSWIRIPGSEVDMAKAVANFGPLSVGIYASAREFRFYKSGILDIGCGPASINHGVTITAYDTEVLADQSTKDYWVVKNSWGANWGDNGYIKIRRGSPCSGGMCGIRSYAVVPLIADPNHIEEEKEQISLSPASTIVKTLDGFNEEQEKIVIQ